MIQTYGKGGGGGSKVKLSSADPTSDYLSRKLVAGDNISLDNTTSGTIQQLKINIPLATKTVTGLLKGEDWDTFNSKANSTINIGVTSPLTGGGTLEDNRTIGINKSSASSDGYLSSGDFTTFNNKQNALHTSQDIATAISDETGSGVLVFNQGPTFVNPTSNDITLSALNRNFVDYSNDTKLFTGVPVDERKKFKVSISYSAPNIVVSIEYISPYTSFSYYINGKKYVITDLTPFTNKTATAAEGLWFIYISSSNIFTLSQTPWTIYEPDVLLWNFRFNASTNFITWIGEERHTAGRDIFQHARNHAQGAIYKTGFSFSQYNGLTTLSTNTDNNFGRAQTQFSNGSFYDEDILNNITHTDSSISSTTANPATNWDLTVNQFLGFTALATTGTSATQIVFTSPRTLVTGQAITVMQGNTTTVRGTTTITTGGTGTTFTVSSVTGLTSGDAIVVGARIPIFYLSSTSPYTWRKITTTTDFLGVSGGNPITAATIATATAQYNNPSTGGFTNMNANRFYPVYIVASNLTSEPLVALLGQGQSTNGTLSTALTESPFQFQNLTGLSALNIQEIVPIYRLVYHYNTSAGFNQSRIRLVDATFINLRVSTLTGTVTNPSVTSLPANSITTDITNFNGILSSANTTVQSALETIDDHNHTHNNLNGITGSSEGYHLSASLYNSIQSSGIPSFAGVTLNGSSGAITLLPATSGITQIYKLPSAYGSSGQVLNTDGSGTLFWGTGSSPISGAYFEEYTYTINDTTTTFNLTNAPYDKNYLFAFIGGIKQNADAYSLTGSKQVTFTNPVPASGIPVEFQYVYGLTIPTTANRFTESYTAISGQINQVLTNTPLDYAYLDVYVNSTHQAYPAFTLNSSGIVKYITFSEALQAGDIIDCVITNSVNIIAPSASSVSTSTIQTNAVTPDKIDFGTPTHYAAINIDGSGYLLNTNYTLYTVPIGTYIDTPKASFLNRSITSGAIITFAHGSGSINSSDYLFYNTYLAPKETKEIEFPGASAGTIFTVSSSAPNVNFRLSGVSHTVPKYEKLASRFIDGSGVLINVDNLAYTSTNKTQIAAIYVCNQNLTTVANIKLAISNSSNSSGIIASDYIFENETLQGGETKEYSNYYMSAGSYLYFQSDTSNVNIIVYGKTQA